MAENKSWGQLNFAPNAPLSLVGEIAFTELAAQAIEKLTIQGKYAGD